MLIFLSELIINRLILYLWDYKVCLLLLCYENIVVINRRLMGISWKKFSVF